MKSVVTTNHFTKSVLGLAIFALTTNGALGQRTAPAEPSAEAVQRQADQLRRMQAQLEEHRAGLAAQMEKLQAEISRLHMEASAKAAKEANSKPPDGKVHVFRLSRARADRVQNTLVSILGSKIQKSAVDSSTNSIIVAARDDDYDQITQLIRVLDVSPEGRQDERRAETLQVRMIWLAGNLPETTGLAEAPDIEPRVLTAVTQLGLSDPTVICQHVTNVAKSWNEPANFEFLAPVVLGSNRLQFQGRGTLVRNSMEQLEVRLSTTVSATVGSETTTPWRMDGSVAMPLRHYMVMGTTNLVLLSGDARNFTCPAALVIFLDEVNPIQPVVPGGPSTRRSSATGSESAQTPRTAPTSGGENPFGTSDPSPSGGKQPERRRPEDNPFK